MQLPGIALWGDSIGRGIDFDSDRGRYAVLRKNFVRLLEKRGVVRIDNHARFGATVLDGLKDFEAWDAPAGITLLQYGGNDCNMSWEQLAKAPDQPHEAVVPLPLFEATLSKFVLLVRARGGRPLLITPPPLVAERFVAWVSRGLDEEAILRFLGDVQYVYRWHESYSNAMRRVASRTRCGLVDLRDWLLRREDYPSLVSVDGMHINQLGQPVLADALEELLVQQLSHAGGTEE